MAEPFTQKIRTGDPSLSSVITNLDPFSLELENSIFLDPSLLKVGSRSHEFTFVYPIEDAFRHASFASPLPIAETTQGAYVKAAADALRDFKFFSYSGANQRIVLSGITPTVVPRLLPVVHMSQPSEAVTEKGWLHMKLLLNNWKGRDTPQTVSTEYGFSSVFRRGFTTAKLVNIWETPDKTQMAYSFVFYNEAIVSNYVKIPILVHYWLDQFSPAIHKSPILRAAMLSSMIGHSNHPVVSPGLLDGLGIRLFNRLYNHTGLFLNSFGEAMLACSVAGVNRIIPLHQHDLEDLNLPTDSAESRSSDFRTVGISLSRKLAAIFPFTPYADLRGLGYEIATSGAWVNSTPPDSSTDFEGAVLNRLLETLGHYELTSKTSRTLVEFRKSTPLNNFSKLLKRHNNRSTLSTSSLGNIALDLVESKRKSLGITPGKAVSKEIGRFTFEGPGSPLHKARTDLASTLKLAMQSKAVANLVPIDVPTGISMEGVPELKAIQPLTPRVKSDFEVSGDIPELKQLLVGPPSVPIPDYVHFS